ncbi:MAG: protein translocase subunit SecD, partial [Candidatus Parcubacteria bacterium]|nr:protein translocase subunit SecD [Candidatus Parcubacteria bacterium]
MFKLDLKKKSWLTTIIIFVLAILAVFYVYPAPWNNLAIKINNSQKAKYNRVIVHFPYFINKPFSLGLDLIGGTALTYKADLSNIAPSNYTNAMDGLRDVIERRVNFFGAKEPRIAVEKVGDEWRLVAELAGITDIKEAIAAIGETPFLEFKEARTDEETKSILELQKAESVKPEPDITILSQDPYFKPTSLNGRYLKTANVQFDSTTNEPIIDIQFDEQGSQIFQELTKNNINKPLAIYLDGAPISTPVVREEISGGKAQI